MSDEKGWYNGYDWKERYDKYKVMQRKIDSDELRPEGPCALCGDPTPEPYSEKTFEYHDEDYSIPYIWEEPAAYVLCHHCHVYKLHQRFARPIAWQAFLAHVRRGGYARDLKDPNIKKEVDAYRAAIKHGDSVIAPLRKIEGRTYTRVIGTEWFANLQRDEASLKDRAARPRP